VSSRVPTDRAATAAYIESQTQMRRYPTAAKLLISQRSVNHTGRSQTELSVYQPMQKASRRVPTSW